MSPLLLNQRIPKKRKRATFRTLDCETDPFKHGRVPRPFVWGAYEGDSDDYLEFATVDELVAWLARQRTTFYAHNGGRFDYHYLRDHINSDEPIMLINGRIAKARIGLAELRDSLNIFPNTRLKDFDDSTGAKLEIDYALMEPERRNDPNAKAEISRYLKQDCVRLWGVVRRYWDEYGKSLTQAGASMKYWSKKYEIDPPRQTKTQFDRYRRFYYGGRVQCFESGVQKCRFSVADINSAYPFAMLRKHPYSPAAVRERHLPAKDEEIQTSLIELDCNARGCFPWRDPDTNELYFPEDGGRIRRYWVTGWEFLTALELDAITNIHIRTVHTFPARIDFKDYIEHFYNLRAEAKKRGDVAGRTFGKYFMNGLYGKFAANCEKYAEYLIATTDTLKNWCAKGYVVDDLWGERFLMRRDPKKEDLEDATNTRWKYYNVATAASITGFVRAYLFKAMRSCSGVIYCDTDSIAARDTSALNFGDGLGAFKNEGSFDRFAIAGKKLYAFHKAGRELEYDPKDEDDPSWKLACKGVDFVHRADGPQRIEEIARGAEVTYLPEVPTYSVMRPEPVFINRSLRATYKDMSKAPYKMPKFDNSLDPLTIRF